VHRNLVAETGHDRDAVEDYRRLSRLGIAAAREGIPWPLVDKAGHAISRPSIRSSPR
jgi:hypothetical protein